MNETGGTDLVCLLQKRTGAACADWAGREEDEAMQFKKRDGLVCAIFNVLTCGIYGIYFWYRYGEDVNVLCREDGKETMNYVLAWLLSVVTCGIYGIYWTYQMASRLDTASRHYGVNVESPVFFTLFMHIPVLGFLYACDIMNKFTDSYLEVYPGMMDTYEQTPGRGPGWDAGGERRQQDWNGKEERQKQEERKQERRKPEYRWRGPAREDGSKKEGSRICKNCGEIVPPDRIYCLNCGYPVNGPAPENRKDSASQPGRREAGMKETDIQDTELCPKCGGEILKGDHFCVHCGSRLD